MSSNITIDLFAAKIYILTSECYSRLFIVQWQHFMKDICNWSNIIPLHPLLIGKFDLMIRSTKVNWNIIYKVWSNITVEKYLVNSVRGFCGWSCDYINLLLKPFDHSIYHSNHLTFCNNSSSNDILNSSSNDIM